MCQKGPLSQIKGARRELSEKIKIKTNKTSYSPFGYWKKCSEGENQFSERMYNFSLDFSAFGPSVLVGPRSKVDLRYKGYAWTPILWSSDNSKR